MSAFNAVIVSLVIVWTPGIALAAYLLGPRRPETDYNSCSAVHTRNHNHPIVATTWPICRARASASISALAVPTDHDGPAVDQKQSRQALAS
jgi:hypothetical protein